MPTIAQLGDAVKKKYPGQYDDVDSTKLGAAMQKKYPGSYDDFTATSSTTAQVPAASGGILSTIGDVAGGIYKSLATPVVNMLARPGQAFAHLTGIGADNNTETPLAGDVPIGFGQTAHVTDPYADVSAGEAPSSVLEKDVGRAAQTISLGLGPVKGGALLGAGIGMEEGGSAGDVAIKAGEYAALGKVGDLAIRALGKTMGAVGSKLLQPFKNSYLPEVEQAAAERGIKLPISAVTGSKVVRALEATVKGGPFGQQIEATVNNARKAILGLAMSLKKDINIDSVVDNTKDPATVGNTIKKAFSSAESVYRETRSQLYDDVTPQLADIPADLTSTRKVLEDIITQKSQSLDPTAKGQIDFYQSMLAKISADIDQFAKTQSPEMQDYLRTAVGTPKQLTFNSIKQTRTDIGQKLKSISDPIATGDKANLKMLYAALSEDLDRTVQMHGAPVASEALKAANEYYKAGIATFNSALGRKIANSTKPELLVKQIIRPGEVSDIRLFKQTVTPDVWEDVKAAFVTDMLENAKGVSGEVEGRRLMRLMARYGDETLTEVLGPEGFQKLRSIRSQSILNSIVRASLVDGNLSAPKLAAQIKMYGPAELLKSLPGKQMKDLMDASKLASAVNYGQRVAEGSQTAEKTRILGYLTGALLKPVVLVKELIGEAALSKFLGSAGGRKYLTKGFGEIPGVAAAGNVVAGIPQAMRDLPKKDIPGTGRIPLKAKLGLSIEDVSQKKNLDTGYKDTGSLSTKLLSRLEGKTTVSKQFISDLTNSGDLRQPERELVRSLLTEEGDKVNATEFANKVKTELLPLERTHETNFDGGYTGRYENISLPHDMRGPIANYSEHIYQSPIKTSAAGAHFNRENYPNYFAHTRVEDVKTPYKKLSSGEIKYGPDRVRRVIELQSDLFQKGRLEGEDSEFSLLRSPNDSLGKLSSDVGSEGVANLLRTRKAELSRLEPYRNTWQERIIREEVAQAAKDGKTKLQFPTGETAMKIEGLGSRDRWYVPHEDGTIRLREAGERDLKVGSKIILDGGGGGLEWDFVVTEVLGDGKFKGVPKDVWDKAQKIDKYEALGAGNEETARHARLATHEETYDLSGKIDKENPIYKFYEKEVARYLVRNFGAKKVTDPQGVTWLEVPIKKEMATKPVQAFGKASLGAILGGSVATAAGVAGTRPATLDFTQKNTEATSTPPVAEEEKKPDIKAIASALANNETGSKTIEDPYSFHKFSGSKLYGEDLGKYQVTEAALKEHAETFLGRSVTKKEFLASPELQDEYIQAFISTLLDAGISIEGILALHSQGMTGWGDPKVIEDKIAKSNKQRRGYVDRGMKFYQNAATSTTK